MGIDEQLGLIRRTTLIIYAAMFPSLVIYGVIAFVVVQPSGDETAAVGAIQMALTCAALAIGGASVLVPRWMLADRQLETLLRSTPDLQRLAQGRDGVLDQEKLRSLQSLDPTQAVLISVAQRWTTSVIVGVALGEAVAICGLVLSLVSREPMQIVPFAAAAVVLMLSHFPRLDLVLERVKTRRGY